MITTREQITTIVHENPEGISLTQLHIKLRRIVTRTQLRTVLDALYMEKQISRERVTILNHRETRYFPFNGKTPMKKKLNRAKKSGEKESRPETVKNEKYPFETFWKMYDKPTERQSCEAKWNILGDEEKPVIMQRLPAYIEATPERHYRKNPLTYLSRKIWLDEILPEPPKPIKKSAMKQLAETGSYE